MAVLISLVFIKLILVIVKVNNSHTINKTLSCLAKTQPQPFLYNDILMILCVNVPMFCAYSIIRNALHLFCFTAKHAFVRFFGNSHCIFRLDRHVGTSFSNSDLVVSISREQDPLSEVEDFPRKIRTVFSAILRWFVSCDLIDQ